MSVDARKEAFDQVGGRFDARVLEPSPPAVTVPPWFADDPVAPERARRPGLPLLGPVSSADLTWDDLTRDEPDLADWCAARWLGAYRRLGALPDRAVRVATCNALHAVAEHVLAPARRRATGKIGLRFTVGRLRDPVLRVGRAGARARVPTWWWCAPVSEDRTPITTIDAAGRFVGIEPGAPADLYQPATTVEPDAALAVDPGRGAVPRRLVRLLVLGARRAARSSPGPPTRGPSSGPSTSTSASTSATRPPAPGAPSDRRPATPPTRSPTCTRRTGRPTWQPDPFWNDTAFAGANLAVRARWSTPTTSARPRSTSSAARLAVLGVPDG